MNEPVLENSMFNHDKSYELVTNGQLGRFIPKYIDTTHEYINQKTWIKCAKKLHAIANKKICM